MHRADCGTVLRLRRGNFGPLMSAGRPLEGIRVLELSQLIAGPSATMLLADMGADVIKLEPPEGDGSRGLGSSRKHGVSATFAAYNRGKRSIALDLTAPDALEAAKRLVASCDVMVETFRPGVMERLGLGYPVASALRPGLIYVSFSGFGRDGPMAGRAGVDMIVQGESGMMSVTGEAGGDPTKIGFTAIDAAAGFALAKCVLGGLVGRLRSGEGSRLHVSLLDVALFMQAGPLTDYMMTEREPPRMGNMTSLGAPAETFRTRDGMVTLSAYFSHQWTDLCRVLGLEAICRDSRFVDNGARLRNRSELHEIIQQKLSSLSSAQIGSLFEGTRVMVGDVLGYRAVVSHPQAVHNGNFQTVRLGQDEQVTVIAGPMRTEGAEEGAMPGLPALGVHGREILEEIGYGPEQIEALERSGALRGPVL